VGHQRELIKQVANYDKKGDQAGLLALQKELGKVMKEVKEELEKQWVAELRKKYVVTIDKEVLKTVNQH
jgi:hypothetical protein